MGTFNSAEILFFYNPTEMPLCHSVHTILNIAELLFIVLLIKSACTVMRQQKTTPKIIR